MFPTSTQKHHWIFPDDETLRETQVATNKRYIARHQPPNMGEEEASKQFLSADEERTLLSLYELQMMEFCTKFQPPMSKAVIGTAFHYFKRFYLYHSVMDHHPKEIMVTCVYLSCKIEEFNLTMLQFVANIRGGREKAMEIILNNELLLMSALKFHLTIHNPYRPVEGLLIDLKTRFHQFDPEKLRKPIDEFLDKVLLTDIPLLFAPSQIALASVLEAGRRCKEKVDPYVTKTLITDPNILPPVVEAVRTIRVRVRATNSEPPNKELRAELEKKLDNCRNQENNPENALYRSRLKEMEGIEDGDGSAQQFDQFDDSFN